MSHLEGYSFDYIAEPGAQYHHLPTAAIEVRDGDTVQSQAEGRAGVVSTTIFNLLSRWLHFLGLGQFYEPDLDALLLPSYRVQKRSRFRRETRRCRRTYVTGLLKRLLVASPVMILSLFGILHLLQVLIGRSHLFWNLDGSRQQLFLPNWGKPGHAGGALVHYPGDASRDVLPIPCHSHNDYWRRAPLYDAIHWGCVSVETDLWLYDEELYVGHTVQSLTADRTFRSLYVQPLEQLLDKMNSHGGLPGLARSPRGVFDTRPEQTLVLLVDLKHKGDRGLPIVVDQLRPLREKGYLTHWNGQEVVPGAVTVVGTGETPFEPILANSSFRDIFFDAPLDRLWLPPRTPIPHSDTAHALDAEIDYGLAMALSRTPEDSRPHNAASDIPLEAFNTSTSYYASTSFVHTVGYVWRGHLSPRQMEIIRGQIRGAKRKGLKVRYWGTPSWPVALRNHVWHVLVKEGADVLNVDDLEAAARQSWTMRTHGLWG